MYVPLQSGHQNSLHLEIVCTKIIFSVVFFIFQSQSWLWESTAAIFWRSSVYVCVSELHFWFLYSHFAANLYGKLSGANSSLLGIYSSTCIFCLLPSLSCSVLKLTWTFITFWLLVLQLHFLHQLLTANRELMRYSFLRF